MLECIIMAIIAYCIGSINFSVIISKKMAGFDVREKGSGNAGSTNMLRSVGKKAAALTLVCDILKGVVAIIISMIIGNFVKEANKELLLQIAGIAVVIGHTFPIFFGFKGGKGVATSLRNFVNEQLENRINMSSICFTINGINKNCIIRILCSSNTIPSINAIHQ